MATTARQSGKRVREAVVAQMLTLLWMVTEAAVAISAGVAARSIVLSTFGVDSLIELFSAGVVLRLVVRSDAGAGRKENELSQGERTASRLVGWALYGVIAFIVASSGAAVVWGLRPERCLPGIILTLASIVVMAILWRWRLRLADELSSPALRGDAACSAVCLYMSVTTLAGLALNATFGWWWVDAVAALMLVWWIRGEAGEALEAARTGRRCDDCSA